MDLLAVMQLPRIQPHVHTTTRLDQGLLTLVLVASSLGRRFRWCHCCPVVGLCHGAARSVPRSSSFCSPTSVFLCIDEWVGGMHNFFRMLRLQVAYGRPRA